MKKRVFVIIFLILCVFMLTGCIMMAGLLGFDRMSAQNLDQGFIEIDWLEGEELKETIAEICKSGTFSVVYNDRYRVLEFYNAITDLSLCVYNDRIEFVYVDTFSFNKNASYGNGWFNPRRIVFDCYGSSYTEEIPWGDVKTTNESYYDQYSGEYKYIRYQDVDHIISDEAAAFLNEKWNNSDLYFTVYGDRDSYTYRIRGNDLISLYRVLYEQLFPYEFLQNAAHSAIVSFIDDLKTVNSHQAAAIIYYISLNYDLTGNEIRQLTNLVNSKVR